jgi:aryl-alcohol dehydrogenase-like predicted oxidoreductase
VNQVAPVAAVEIEVSLQAYEQQTKDGKHYHYFSLFSIPWKLINAQWSPPVKNSESPSSPIRTQSPLSIVASSWNSPNSPLGHGLLTGQIKSRQDMDEGDFRRGLGRFQDDVSFVFYACSRRFA